MLSCQIIFMLFFYLPQDCVKNINQIIANGKRFLTYNIVKNLENNQNHELLNVLTNNVTDCDKRKGAKHKVFQTSFDCKELFNNEILETKIDYIHINPCKGKWNLVSDYVDYEFSSASFYETGKENVYLTHYKGV